MPYASIAESTLTFLMRRLVIIALLTLFSCRGQEESPADTLEPETADSSLPGPRRAAAAAKLVRPGLERDLAKRGLRFGDPVFIRAFKAEEELELWVRDRKTEKFALFRTYPIAAQSGQLGPKLAEGDYQVPEGFYFVPRSKLNPNSNYHLAFNIGYPNSYDRHHKRTGSFIMIHGNRISIGCLAMTDAKIEEIYTLCDAALRSGQDFFRVHLFPFRMTDERLARTSDERWFSFWQNLKQGYDHFESKHLPPNVTVKEGRYAFE
ncbi:L,D-transpeptidase family protein [Haloferula sp.]|uniref:L,D-transpeptidase family protein n=1 Tax=Haloferula sp. TaxID=2497595 RepID=UPI00329DAFBB